MYKQLEMILTTKNNNLVDSFDDDGAKKTVQPQREILIRYVPIFSLLTFSVTFMLSLHRHVITVVV